MSASNYQNPHHVVPVPHHGPLTRIVHGLLALAVIEQLATSQFMQPAEPGKTANAAFEVHEIGGLIAFALILGFWALVAFRRRGTPAGLLVPWFSGQRLSDLWDDLKTHAHAVLKLRMPAYDARSPFACAVHGLGLMAITVMTVTGSIYWAMGTENPDAGGITAVLMSLHHTFATLAWIYLIGHAATALLYHFASSSMNLGAMWSLPSKSETKK